MQGDKPIGLNVKIMPLRFHRKGALYRILREYSEMLFITPNKLYKKGCFACDFDVRRKSYSNDNYHERARELELNYKFGLMGKREFDKKIQETRSDLDRAGFEYYDAKRGNDYISNLHRLSLPTVISFPRAHCGNDHVFEYESGPAKTFYKNHVPLIISSNHYTNRSSKIGTGWTEISRGQFLDDFLHDVIRKCVYPVYSPDKKIMKALGIR